MKIKAVVPIKLNSKRLPNKNIQKIQNKTLIEWVVSELNKVKYIDEIIVYCSDKNVDDFIESKHKTILRDKSLDEDDKNIHNIMDALLVEEQADIWIIQHATSPFIRAKTIEDMLEKVIDKETIYHSSFAVVKHQKYAWYMGNPLNFDLENIGFTQTTEPIYMETSGPFIFYDELFKKTRRRVSSDPYIKVISVFEGIDIDTKEDFDLAKIIGENYIFE